MNRIHHFDVFVRFVRLDLGLPERKKSGIVEIPRCNGAGPWNPSNCHLLMVSRNLEKWPRKTTLLKILLTFISIMYYIFYSNCQWKIFPWKCDRSREPIHHRLWSNRSLFKNFQIPALETFDFKCNISIITTGNVLELMCGIKTDKIKRMEQLTRNVSEFYFIRDIRDWTLDLNFVPFYCLLVGNIGLFTDIT